MRIPNIFTETELRQNHEIPLDPKASQHLAKVLRMKVGYQVRLFNGDGLFYPATLTDVGKKVVIARTGDTEQPNTESSLWSHLGQVISRGDRMDYAIQKATEMGISEITPLFSERCEVRLDEERQHKRQIHWQNVAISAAEQCGRARVPKIHAPARVVEWCSDQQADNALKLVLHHRDTQDLERVSPSPKHVILLIGPEGGLSDDEIRIASEQGFVSTTLGPRILRTETAPVTALGVIQWLWGDFR